MKTPVQDFTDLVTANSGVTHTIRYLRKERVWLLRFDQAIVSFGLYNAIGRQHQSKRQQFTDPTLDGVLQKAANWIRANSKPSPDHSDGAVRIEPERQPIPMDF